MAAWSSTARTYMPGSRVPSGLGTSARSVTWPVLSSTVRSVNSSAPLCGYSVPSSNWMRTLALSPWPSAALSLPLARPWRSFITADAGWVMFTYTGSICWTVASGVAAPWPTSAPSVTSARPMRPLMGEVTVAYDRLIWAVFRLARATAMSAAAWRWADTALS